MGNKFDPTTWVYPDVTIGFDPRHVDCAHCPLLETYSRKQCRMTGVYISDDRATGAWCPLRFTDEDITKITEAQNG